METTKILDKVIGNLGPLDVYSIHLLKLTATLGTTSSCQEIESQINKGLKMGIDPSSIYHAIISVSETIGIKKAIKTLEIAEKIINYNIKQIKLSKEPAIL
ncbi:MAG: hypothetical protein JW717_04840 [Marinilabiliaceae bacterium]|nr:hypothetical protein [Marinilabiliaceae bacterium]